MVAESTIHCRGAVSVNSAHWSEAIEDALQIKAQSETRPAKRRKVEPPEPVALQDGDYVHLIDRTLCLEFDGQSSQNKLFAPVDNKNCDISLQADIIVRLEPNGQQMSLRIFARDEALSLIEFKFDESDLPREAQKDLDYVDEVRKGRNPSARPKVRAPVDFNYATRLRFRRRDDTHWNIIVELGVTMKCVNEWSIESLLLSKKKWWQLLAHAFPNGPSVENAKPVAPRDFYQSVHVPAKDVAVPDSVQHPTLDCTLLPFQRRAVRWLLRKEGADLTDGDSDIVKYDKAGTDVIPPTFFEVLDKKGKKCYVSHILGIVSKDLKALQRESDRTKGGILSEEMGLGKTVELIALLCLHRRQQVNETVWDEHVKKHILSTGATLIITPASILHQWQNEIEMHAPGLKVITYRGVKAYKNKPMPDIVAKLAQCDVVLTSYNVLSSEIHYAQPLPDRKLRNEKVHAPKRSPLVELSWWRVCLDEAQMVESGVSAAAIVAREVPKINAWAVSGTPLRKDIDDLWGLLLFLRYEPFCARNKDVWHRLTDFNHAAFRSLFQDISLRHSKDFVRDEISLPAQKRVVVSVPFSQVEEQNYQHLFAQMCEDCGVDQTGAPLRDDWDPDDYTEQMRIWLTRLRQTCLHPEAGERNRKAFGSKGPLRTVEEVLEVMIDRQLVNIRNDERTLYASMIKRGQMYEHGRNPEAALDVWLGALDGIRSVTKECREALNNELRQLTKGSSRPHEEGSAGKSMAADGDGDSDIEDEDNPDAKSTQLGTLRLRLRSFLELEHNCVFWIATAYFQLKEKEEQRGKPDEDGNVEMGEPDEAKAKAYARKETKYYELAKRVRVELMQETRSRALDYIRKLRRRKAAQDFTEIPVFDPPKKGAGGIESRRIFDDITDLANQLNEQVIVVDEWRQILIQLLMETLVDEDGEDQELKGDELEVSVEKQEQSFAYLSALRALAADREQILTEIKNGLVEIDTKQALERQGKIHAFLFRQLIAIKDQVKPSHPEGKSMKQLLAELRTLVNNLKQQEEGGSNRAQLERQLAEDQLRRLQKAMGTQNKACADLFRELEMLRGATNARVEFYRQMQVVSDMVESLDEDEKKRHFTDSVFGRMVQDELRLDQKITQGKSKSRYLQHLKGQKVEESPNCGICLSSYEIGVLTSCGHSFCKECMMLWWKQSRSCPQCKLLLRSNDINQISYKPAEMTMHHEESTPASPERSPGSSSPKIYANVDDRVLRQIKEINVGLSFGTKIDMITRHLLWLKQNEPEFKAVIFSQWSDVLEVIKMSLRKAEIGFASLEKREGIDHFRNDPDISCFLLHSKSQSAGLTLVNATHVFLCEPLINTALELQAISRVHRIGQKQATTVWLYVVSGTVEQSVLELATQNRLALMGKEGGTGRATPQAPSDKADDAHDESLNSGWDHKLDAAESTQLREGLNKFVEKVPGGGELVGKEHLWDCLFRVVSHSTHDPAKDELIRREIMAGAAEGRIRDSSIGVPGSSRDA